MIKSQNWILVERFRDDRKRYEEYVKQITKEKVEIAKVKLNELDTKTLRMIYQLRIVTSSQIAKTIHKGRTHPFKFANNSIKKMFNFGCIDRFFPITQCGSPQTHVVLTPIGARLIEKKGFRKVLVLPQNWRHTVFRNDIFAEIYNQYNLFEWKQEMALEWTNNGVDKTLKPDAFIGWKDGEREFYAMFEIDLGTEHMTVLHQKVKNYCKYFNGEGFKTDKWQPYEDVAIIPKVIFIFDDEERAKKLRSYLKRVDSEINFQVFNFDNLTL